MRIVITGGAGFIGSRLARTLLENDPLVDPAGQRRKIDKLVIFDRVAPENLPDDPRLEIVVGQANDQGDLAGVLEGADSVFHFASVVSGEAEADLALGLSVNLDGTRMLLDILARQSGKPRLIFASSFAVYGGGSSLVNDETPTFPLGSYGVQKLCCELLIGDYSRRGLLDGRAMRFPTIAVRPGKANRANSSFISNIIREPAAGRETVCPVPKDTEIALMSPGKLIEAIVRVHNLDGEKLGWPRSLLLPALKVSVAHMLDALEENLGPKVRALVRFETDPAILPMIKSWPLDVKARRATALGIEANSSAAEIVSEFLHENSP
jgi:D-erythronate 2-dehydrogenase